MEILQSTVVVTANVLVPGSGVAVTASFELVKVCFQIAQILSGMGDAAASIKTQRENIQDDVEEFAYMLGLLKGHVQNQDELSEGLQQTIVAFERDLTAYNRVMARFKKRNLLKQLLFRREMDSVSTRTKKTIAKLKERLGLECSVVSRNQSRSLTEDSLIRECRYIAQVDSPEVMCELCDSDNQKETLSIIKRLENPSADAVVSVLEDKLQSSSSAAVKNEVDSLPDWYFTENQVEVDETCVLGFGGDARVLAGALSGETPVAVKVFNTDFRHSELARRTLIGTLNLWRTLSHDNICQFYGVCYLTATPSVVMELCENGSLDRFLRQTDQSKRASMAVELMLQAAEGVAMMHSSGIVHGDLKCDNILITNCSPPQAKVSDFDRSFDWIARSNRFQEITTSANSVGVAISEAIPWVAPECVEGKLPSPASDVYSFGMTLFQALTGKLPFYHVGGDEELKRSKAAHELPTRESKLISARMWKIITQTSHQDPQQRPTLRKVIALLRAQDSEDEPDKATSSASLKTPTRIALRIDLAQICAELELVVQKIKASADRVSLDKCSIAKDIIELSCVLKLLYQCALSEVEISGHLQELILKFAGEASAYQAALVHFEDEPKLVKLFFGSKLADNASETMTTTGAILKMRLVSKIKLSTGGLLTH